MHIFTSDARLRELQRQAANAKTVRDLPADERRTALENEREVREHARWRSLGYGLFIGPLVFWGLYALAAWIMAPM